LHVRTADALTCNAKIVHDDVKRTNTLGFTLIRPMEKYSRASRIDNGIVKAAMSKQSYKKEGNNTIEDWPKILR